MAKWGRRLYNTGFVLSRLERKMAYGHLGQEIGYPEQYDAGLIFPIARTQGRAEITADLPTFYGADVWHGYEISWLDTQGKPQVACARFVVPCDSPFLIESKSFKLYLNSYNQTAFAHVDEVAERMQSDLSQACGSFVQVYLQPLTSLAGQPWTCLAGECIDDLQITINNYSFSDDFCLFQVTWLVSSWSLICLSPIVLSLINLIGLVCRSAIPENKLIRKDFCVPSCHFVSIKAFTNNVWSSFLLLSQKNVSPNIWQYWLVILVVAVWISTRIAQVRRVICPIGVELFGSDFVCSWADS